MSSRSGSAMSTHNKRPVTYGKSSRKNLRTTLAVRTSDPYDVDPYDIPTSPTDPVRTMFKPPSAPRPSHQMKITRDHDAASEKSRPQASGSSMDIRGKRSDGPGGVNGTTRKRPQVRGTEVGQVKKTYPRSTTATPPSHTTKGEPVLRRSDSDGPKLSAFPTKKRPASRSTDTQKPPPKRVATGVAAPRDALRTSPEIPQKSKAKERPQTRRPRLIDTLSAQRLDSPELDSASDDGDVLCSSFLGEPPTPSQQSTQQTQDSQSSQARLTTRPGVVLQGKRVKYTYGQTRTILVEPPKAGSTGIGSRDDDIDALLSPLPMANPDPFALEDDEIDPDGDIRPAIKSVHELRRAGANNRFADEMEDLLTRIGAPGQEPLFMRRNGLMELSQKLHRKDFITQFRDHATRDRVAKQVGQEEDPISGFALMSILVIFLRFSAAAHLLRQLQEDGLSRLLSRLLHESDDIDLVASQRKTKLSKVSRSTLNNVKNSLMGLDIWHGHSTKHLSPQTLALQLLDTLCQHTDPEYSGGVIKAVEGDLAAIMNDYPEENGRDSVAFPLIVSILEAQSSLTMDNGDELSWISQHSPKIAQFLQGSVPLWPRGPSDVETTVLKLAINTTNTARGAAAFNQEALLASLSSCICDGFTSIQDSVSNRRLRAETYDGLLLVLGVTINIVEHCPPARNSVDVKSLDRLIDLYLQNQKTTSEANSVEQSQLSVALGYLAVLLGYLCLSPSVRTRLAVQTRGAGLSGLIESIQEFVNMYRSVDSKVYELEGLVRELKKSNR